MVALTFSTCFRNFSTLNQQWNWLLSRCWVKVHFSTEKEQLNHLGPLWSWFWAHLKWSPLPAAFLKSLLNNSHGFSVDFWHNTKFSLTFCLWCVSPTASQSLLVRGCDEEADQRLLQDFAESFRSFLLTCDLHDVSKHRWHLWHTLGHPLSTLWDWWSYSLVYYFKMLSESTL